MSNVKKRAKPKRSSAALPDLFDAGKPLEDILVEAQTRAETQTEIQTKAQTKAQTEIQTKAQKVVQLDRIAEPIVESTIPKDTPLNSRRTLTPPPHFAPVAMPVALESAEIELPTPLTIAHIPTQPPITHIPTHSPTITINVYEYGTSTLSFQFKIFTEQPITSVFDAIAKFTPIQNAVLLYKNVRLFKFTVPQTINLTNESKLYFLSLEHYNKVLDERNKTQQHMLMDEPVEQTIEQTDTISEIITITIMTSTGSQQISAFLSDKVHKILNQTGKKSLTLDGDKLDPDQTLDELGITDGDVIDAI